MNSPGQLQSQLRDDEQLLWQGGPDPRVWFSRVDAFLAYLTIGLAMTLALLWYLASRFSGSVGYVRVAIPTVFWLCFLPGRLIYRQYSRSRTTYAVTTTRALIVAPRSSREKPLQDETVQILRGDERHVTLSIGTAAPRQSPFHFENVADPAALLAALVQAGAQTLP